jgi:hypothetical protein
MKAAMIRVLRACRLLVRRLADLGQCRDEKDGACYHGTMALTENAFLHVIYDTIPCRLRLKTNKTSRWVRQTR